MDNLLIEKIKGLAKTDQAMRKSDNWDGQVDKRNTAELKKIVAEHGWPTVSLVGKEASHLAWLLVQHADHDLEFQKICLNLMREVRDQNPAEISPKHIAYLTDRILVAEGKPQLFGTQFYTDDKGSLVPRAIEDEKNLDQRRAAWGLEPFEKYRKLMGERA